MKPTTLAHLSDLHFGRLHEEIAEALLADLHRTDPDLIVVSGDLTQHASAEEFAQARAYLDRFPKPPLVVPGNHDVPSWNLWLRFTRPTARFRRHIEPDPFPLQQSGEITVLGIDTTRPHGWYFDWSRGRISGRQLRRVDETFASLPTSRLKVMVTHHPFLHPPQGKERALVRGPGDVMRTLAGHNVDLLLAGHFHKAYSGVAATRHPDAGGIVVAQTSTSTSHRLRAEPNAYNWFEYDAGRLSITIRAWDEQAFAEAAHKIYVKRQGHWVREKE